MSDQQVHRRAEGRVGGDAGPAVRPPALKADRQVGGGDELALDRGGFGDKVTNDVDPGFDGPGGAASLLDGQGAQVRAGLEAFVGQPGGDLVRLAA